MLGDYRVIEHVGKGGMGKVYLAEASETGKRYAVRWRSSGPVGRTIGLDLTDKGSGRIVIDASTPNDGLRNWTVPNLAPGRW